MTSSSGYQHINGLRLFVHRFRDEAATPSGLTIVLLHGFMDSGATWDMVAPALARAGHDVVAPDLRGFGQSDNIGAGGYYHFPDYVADLAELVDALAPRRLAVVGHSMGGTVAALYAGTYPDKVERLALLEGLGPMATEPSIAVDRMQAWLRTLREVSRAPKPLTSMQEAIERLSLHHPRVPRDVIESRAKLLTKADDLGRLLWAYDPLHRTTAPTPFSVDAFKEFLKRIECPTLVVSGGPTGWHPPDEAERVASLKLRVPFELPNAGHMMHWTEPTALAQRLAQFFGEPPLAKPRPPMSAVGVTSSGNPGHVAAAQTAGTTTPGAAPPSLAGAPSAAPGPTAPPTGLGSAQPPAAPAVMPMPSLTAAPSVTGAPGPTAPPQVTATPSPTAAPGVTAPGRPIYGGAAADLGAASYGPAAGAVPVGPTRPSTGTPQQGGGGSG